MIQAQVIGVEAVTRALGSEMPAEARVVVRAAIRGLGYTLQGHVVTDYLNGRVLHRRTGRLARSVNTQFTETETRFESATGSNVWYGRLWELFGYQAHVIRPKTAKALYWKGAAHPVHSVTIPARPPKPWLRPALDAMRPQIHSTLVNAMRGVRGRAT